MSGHLLPCRFGVIIGWFARTSTIAGALLLRPVGAEEETWWSLRPIAAVEVPDPQGASGWVRTPVDAFILDRLNRASIAPSAEADRRTLIRRVTFDLTGLPPTPEEISAFLSDRREDAYERLVDRLLATPAYAERQARHWLDLARYADTHGFDKDKRRPHAWPYRDYVIRAFMADKPYRQFVTEQLAGDVIDPTNPDAVAATGFLAAGPWDFVGHVELREGTRDKEIVRSLDRDEIVKTVSSVFTSLTVHCARCHDHKFDPIPQADYYAMQAVFAGVERVNRPWDSDPAVMGPRAELSATRRELSERVKRYEEEIETRAAPGTAAVNAEIEALQCHVAAQLGERGATLGYHSAIAREAVVDASVAKWVQVDLGAVRDIDQVVLAPAHEVFGGHPGPGFGFPLRYRVEASSDAHFLRDVITIFDRTASEQENPGDVAVVIEAGSVRGRYVRVTATELWERTNDYCFALAELAVYARGENVAAGKEVSARDPIEAGSRWGRALLTDGVLGRGALGSGALGSGTDSSERLADWWSRLRLLQARREALETAAILSLDPQSVSQLKSARSELAACERALSSLPPAGQVYAVASGFPDQGNFSPPPNGEPRPIRVLGRGDVDLQEGDPVAPGAVSAIDALPSRFLSWRSRQPTSPELDQEDGANQAAVGEGARRIALARWITAKENPLTWRSIANRIWQQHFGRGIVDTPGDFGRMGGVPSHPELLDWLAAEMRDEHLSIKTAHRLLVTSAVYRQSSSSRAERGDDAVAMDSGNRLLWRMSRRRLEAEEIYDATLLASGDLNREMFGPGFDRFAFESDHSPRYLYRSHDENNASRRRSIYRFVVRSVADPYFESLDCAEPSTSVGRRGETYTPIQALALMNHPFALRCAERLGTLCEESTDPVGTAFLRAIGRDPRSDERAVLTGLHEKHGPAVMCRAVFNMNEFVFID